MRPLNFERATDLTAAVKLKTNTKQFIAGGTNLVDLLKKEIAQPEGLIDITKSLSTAIVQDEKQIHIGAMCSNTAITTNSAILNAYPLLAKAVLVGASPQIRNMASAAGNILQRNRCPYFYDTTTSCNKRQAGSGCSALTGEQRMHAIIGYSTQCVAVHPSDFAVALAALDASVLAQSATQEKITIPFADFHVLPGETPTLDNSLPENAIITGITIPTNQFNSNYAYVKLRDRTSYAFALVSVAAALQLKGKKIVAVRLASGGVAAKPWRWHVAEKFLKGKTVNVAQFKKAADLVVASVKPLEHNEFKVALLHGAIVSALTEAAKI